MKKELIDIGHKSKKAITSELNFKKKNKVLKDYYLQLQIVMVN